MGTGEFNAGGNHAMDYYPIRGGVDIHGTETGISSSLMSHLAHQAGAYPGFRSMKRLGVFLLPPGWDASPSQGYPQH